MINQCIKYFQCPYIIVEHLTERNVLYTKVFSSVSYFVTRSGFRPIFNLVFCSKVDLSSKIVKNSSILVGSFSFSSFIKGTFLSGKTNLTSVETFAMSICLFCPSTSVTKGKKSP